MTALARSHVERFRTVVGRRLGFQFDDGKLDFLADILRARLDATASQSASHYLDWFDGNSSDVELPVVAESITVGETYFFRHADQFRAFAEVMLPDRLRSRAQDRMIRIVSAGCASGDEAYTLAILVEKHVADLAAWNVDIRGLDVTPSAIGRARRAIYSTWSLRETSTHEREASFVRRGREFELDPRIKQMVTFECRNLVDDDPTFWRPGSLDVVFCRNVTMYFAPEVARAVIDRIAASLAPGGYLVLGHAETLRGISRDFHLCQTHETFYYQRRSVAREGDDATRAASAPGFALESPSSKTPPSEVDSWVDVIQRASDRIAALSGDVGRRSAPALANIFLLET